jgi:hypothetical protein
MMMMVAAREDHSDASEGTGNSVTKKNDMLDGAIEQYRKLTCLDENSDPLLFW